MPGVVPAIVLGAALLAGAPGVDHVVEAEWLDVLDVPGADGFLTARLRRGERVEVVGEEPGGWLAIVPPRGALDWIDARDVEEVAPGVGRVVGPGADVRAGRKGARIPGPPLAVLEEGDSVRLLDRPPLRHRRGRAAAPRTWRAIAPADDEARYVRAEGVRRVERSGPARLASEAGPPLDPVDATLGRVGPPRAPGQLPAGVEAELARIEAQHRAAIDRPLEGWYLDSVRRQYEDLLSRQSDPVARAIIAAHAEQARRQDDAGRAARAFVDELDRSRRLDDQVVAVRRGLARADVAVAGTFDARGRLEPSSRLVEGRPVFALVDDAGATAAYLLLPPGMATDRLLGHHVGLRGSSRFDPDLQGRVMVVSELVPLPAPPP